jgi:hypothetical protein
MDISCAKTKSLEAFDLYMWNTDIWRKNNGKFTIEETNDRSG